MSQTGETSRDRKISPPSDTRGGHQSARSASRLEGTHHHEQQDEDKEHEEQEKTKNLTHLFRSSSGGSFLLTASVSLLTSK